MLQARSPSRLFEVTGVLDQSFDEELQVPANTIGYRPVIGLLGQILECLCDTAARIGLNHRFLGLYGLLQVFVERNTAGKIEHHIKVPIGNPAELAVEILALLGTLNHVGENPETAHPVLAVEQLDQSVGVWYPQSAHPGR
jgi:hypothetical protein